MQNATETLDQFYTRLRQLASNCEFDKVDAELKSQIILGCKSSTLRRKALEDDKCLEDLLKLGRVSEAAAIQVREIEEVEERSAKINKLHIHVEKKHAKEEFKAML